MHRRGASITAVRAFEVAQPRLVLAKALALRSPGPSFRRALASRARVRRVGWELGFEEPVWGINDKTDTRAWAGRLGVLTPRELGSWASMHQVPWTDLPERFALKPVRGSAESGVRLLVRQDERRYRDLRCDVLVTTSEVIDAHEAATRHGLCSAAVLAEELVIDARYRTGLPVDWKCYTFFGSVGLVLARRPRPSRVGWRVFDPTWQPLGPTAYPDHDDDAAIDPPIHAEALLEVASSVSAAIPRPFVRVDLYDTVDGPLLGEVTPEPGGRQAFRRDIDRRLGEMWEEAEARVLARAAAFGALAPGADALGESALRRTRTPGAQEPDRPRLG